MRKELIFVLLGLELLVASSKYKIIESRLKKIGSHVEFQFETPTESVLVEFPDDSNMTITKTSPPEIKPGYKYTNNGTLAVFEILKVTEDEAGRYTFEFIPEDATSESETFYYDVVLANLSCSLDHPDGLILKSDCLGVKRDKVAVRCHLDLFPKAKLYFEFKWRTKYGRHGKMKVVNANDTYVEAYIDDVVLEKDDVFECSVKDLQWSENLSGKNTIYAMNRTVKELTFYKFGLMHPENQRPVECQAVTSPFINCLYKWIYLGGSNITTFPGSILHEEDIKKEGLYECLASCAIKEHSPGKCVLLGDRFEFSFQAKDCQKSKSTSWLFILIIPALVIWSVISIMLYRNYEKRKSERSNQNKQAYAASKREQTELLDTAPK